MTELAGSRLDAGLRFLAPSAFVVALRAGVAALERRNEAGAIGAEGVLDHWRNGTWVDDATGVRLFA